MSDESFRVEYYLAADESCPFQEWLCGLRDRIAESRIRARLARVRCGNFGVNKSLGDGVHELKIDHGPGYRLYYALAGKMVVLLLIGGDKSTQSRDIGIAKGYWKDYRER